MEDLEGALTHAEGKLNELKETIDNLPNNDQDDNDCCHAATSALELYEVLIGVLRHYINENNNNFVINHTNAAAPAAGGKRKYKKTRKTRKSRK